MLRQVIWREFINDAGQRDHLTDPQLSEQWFIKASMRALAAVAVWLVRWV